MNVSAGTALPSAERISDLVRSVVDAEVVTPDSELFALDGFDSLAIAELVADIESLLGRELPPEVSVPENFETPSTIAAAIAAYAQRNGARAGT